MTGTLDIRTAVGTRAVGLLNSFTAGLPPDDPYWPTHGSGPLPNVRVGLP